MGRRVAGENVRGDITQSAFTESKVTNKDKRSRTEVSATTMEDMATDHSKPDSIVPLAEPALRIAAFNIQILGVNKMKRKNVTEILLKIINRYDLIVIQEVRDRSQTAIDKLIENLNKLDPDDPFVPEESERLGRSNSKEQYVFLYRPSRLTAVDSYQYDDGLDDGSDVFQREPYAVRFRSPTTELQDFAIIAIHTAPKDAVKEIGALHKVYDVTKAHWNLEDILIAGDFNADEGYVDQDDWANIALRTDRRFKWLIGDQVDTTVGNTDRAYDRFVVAGKKLRSNVVPGSARCYRFDEDLKLSKDVAEDVSDHYPIELQLKGKYNKKIQQRTSTDLSVVIHQKKPLRSVKAARYIYKIKPNGTSAGFRSTVLCIKGGAMSEVRATRSNVHDVVKALREFQHRFPDVITENTVSMAAAYVAAPVLTSEPHVYGLLKREGKKNGADSCSPSNCPTAAAVDYDVTVTVALRRPYLCQVTIVRHVS